MVPPVSDAGMTQNDAGIIFCVINESPSLSDSYDSHPKMTQMTQKRVPFFRLDNPTEYTIREIKEKEGKEKG